MLGVAAVVPMSAREKWGIEELQQELILLIQNKYTSDKPELQMKIPDVVIECIDPIAEILSQQYGYNERMAKTQALRVITRKSAINLYRDNSILNEEDIKILINARNDAAYKIDEIGMNHRILEATIRYDMLDKALQKNNLIIKEEIREESRSEKAD